MYKADTQSWYLERLIRLFAGIFIIGSVALGFLVNVAWFAFSGLVGMMLTIFALTGFCPMSILLYARCARALQMLDDG